jgi:hypothetical protein
VKEYGLTVTAMRFDSTCRHPTNTYGVTHCASCRTPQHDDPDTTDVLGRTKLRDAELVEPLLRKFYARQAVIP